MTLMKKQRKVLCKKQARIIFIRKANLIHEDDYDYSDVDYINCKTKVAIICRNGKHGKFFQTPDHHINQKNGCLKCSKVYRYTPEEWIEEAIKVFGGDKFDFTESIYITAKTPIIIGCLKCQYKFKTTPFSFLRQKYGCKKCFGTYQYTNDEWISKAKSLTSDLYDYSKVNYINAATKVTIICTNCNDEYEQTPNNHIRGHGCLRCYGTYSYSNEEWIEKAIQLNGNQKYNYGNTQYVNVQSKVIQHNHVFSQKPMSHLYGHEGCGKCRHIKQHSKQQILWLTFIAILHNIKIQHAENDGEFSIPDTRYKADGYCFQTNTIYEFHGDYWHGNPNKYKSLEYNKSTHSTFGKLYESTILKEEVIKTIGFNLVICWESDWKKLNRCVTVLQRKYRNVKSNSINKVCTL
jgi:hypothetical protein